MRHANASAGTAAGRVPAIYIKHSTNTAPTQHAGFCNISGRPFATLLSQRTDKHQPWPCLALPPYIVDSCPLLFFLHFPCFQFVSLVLCCFFFVFFLIFSIFLSLLSSLFSLTYLLFFFFFFFCHLLIPMPGQIGTLRDTPGAPCADFCVAPGGPNLTLATAPLFTYSIYSRHTRYFRLASSSAYWHTYAHRFAQLRITMYMICLPACLPMTRWRTRWRTRWQTGTQHN